mmetsp:Transcript_42782/g.100300  ORF Transcript_42782/g.100300 Transcript_42782/m.100300 type:complete len:300 (-) Transcript_42782:487-1386(-)
MNRLLQAAHWLDGVSCARCGCHFRWCLLSLGKCPVLFCMSRSSSVEAFIQFLIRPLGHALTSFTSVGGWTRVSKQQHKTIPEAVHCRAHVHVFVVTHANQILERELFDFILGQICLWRISVTFSVWVWLFLAAPVVGGHGFCWACRSKRLGAPCKACGLTSCLTVRSSSRKGCRRPLRFFCCKRPPCFCCRRRLACFFCRRRLPCLLLLLFLRCLFPLFLIKLRQQIFEGWHCSVVLRRLWHEWPGVVVRLLPLAGSYSGGIFSGRCLCLRPLLLCAALSCQGIFWLGTPRAPNLWVFC